MKAVVSYERPARPEMAPDEIWASVEKCWEDDPLDRPSFEQIAAELWRMTKDSLSDTVEEDVVHEDIGATVAMPAFSAQISADQVFRRKR